MKVPIVYFSFTPLPPFYLILIFILKYYPIFKIYLTIFATLQMSLIVTRETTESFSTFIEKENFQSQ